MADLWSERRRRSLGVLLVVLATLQAWLAGGIFPWHPLLALVGATQAVFLVPAVVFTWNPMRREPAPARQPRAALTGTWT
jgi:hypothetical protein